MIHRLFMAKMILKLLFFLYVGIHHIYSSNYITSQTMIEPTTDGFLALKCANYTN